VKRDLLDFGVTFVRQGVNTLESNANGGEMTKSKKFIRIFIRVVSGLLILAVLLSVLGIYTVRRSFPQVDGTLHVTGLHAGVDVYRDARGIPQIYAGDLHDLFFAQGYVHAQERFWQMDFWRHIGSGRLSELFGASEVKTDAFLRTMGWAANALQEWESSSPEDKAILQAYTDGVNAYLSGHQGAALSLEYAVLKLLNPHYVPEPWTPVNSLTWGKAMAWDLRGNIEEEIERAMLLKTLGLDQVNQLFPPYPSDHPLIVPGFSPVASAPAAAGAPLASYPEAQLAAVQSNFSSLDPLLGPGGTGIGSNSWVVAGSHTASGKPLLANDPHLSIQMPSIWFQIGLHCRPEGDACPYEVAGFSFAGVPGVIIGHNGRIAWGVTNVGPDVMDLYIEKVNPQNPDQYEVNGNWVDMTVRTETIQVSGGKSVTLTVRSTRHGPIISDVYLPDKFSPPPGIQAPEKYVVALRWTALEPAHIFDAIWGFDKAQNWDDFRQAARAFTVPAQNLVYADVDGNIGYQMPGNIPIRAGGDGRLPVPGWTDQYQWTGYIPFEQLPHSFNPPSGYIVTANNAVVGPDYPYLITSDWDYGFRAQRIVDLITTASGPIDRATIEKMQFDNADLNAAALLPILTGLKVQWGTPAQAVALDMLKNWDDKATADSKPALIFEDFWWFLLKDTFTDKAIPQDYWPKGGNRWFEVMRELVQQPDSPWWDDPATAKVERRDDIFAQAFMDAVDNLQHFYGKDPARWPAWGAVHTASFRNQSLGESGVAPIEALFNRGPFPVSGGESIVNATGWDVFSSFEVTWLPSMRMIVDLGNLDDSLTVHTTGQSGHAYAPHYIDLAPLWASGKYYPLLWDPQQVKAAADDHLTLAP
jgi:penicillin amidase